MLPGLGMIGECATSHRKEISMIIITATYKGQKIKRIAYSEFQAFMIINTFAREGAINIGMREEMSK